MNLIQSCETVDYKFAEDDKNILVDGMLELHSSTYLTRKNLFGDIDVQIKGHLSCNAQTLGWHTSLPSEQG